MRTGTFRLKAEATRDKFTGSEGAKELRAVNEQEIMNG
jgi:hypothetical protein